MKRLLSKLPGWNAARDAVVPASYGMRLLKLVRRVVVFVLGLSVVLVGLVMIVSPGPAFIVIPLGLAILATEFLWARRILEALKRRLVNRSGSQAARPSAPDARPPAVGR